jgi:hypothetical protein
MWLLMRGASQRAPAGDVLPKRFGKYGLTLHPDKTWLLVFKSRTG